MDIGRYGVWRRADQLGADLARQIEALGYGTIWIGGSPAGDLELAEAVLDGTTRVVVATSIVNMWRSPAPQVARAYHRIAVKHPDRFLLGVGMGHPEADSQYRSPLRAIGDYLDVLDAEGVPVRGRALAALGPKALKLAAERSAGALPYLTTPEHTREAREVLGPDVLLVPEQKVVLGTDPEQARAVGRPYIDVPYLHLANYVANLKRLGFTDDDVANGGSDRLVDALAVHGDADRLAAGLTAHLDAGADHVAAQFLHTDEADPVPSMREVAAALQLTR